jgi:hypothetical protein
LGPASDDGDAKPVRPVQAIACSSGSSPARIIASRQQDVLGSSTDRSRRSAPPPDNQETAMAKGQKKSNKEVRKPKAEKPKAAPASGFSTGSKTPVK